MVEEQDIKPVLAWRTVSARAHRQAGVWNNHSTNEEDMLAWSEQFATGSALVDMQHRMLIDKINQLEQLLKGPPPSKATCDELLNFLGSYVNTHFKFEEQCMERARCPVHEKNKQAHAAFLNVFAKHKERYLAEGPKPELLRSLQTTASDWIKSHILSVDIELKKCAGKS